MDLREAREADFDAMGGVFYAAVHHGAARHYSTAQLSAWAPEIWGADVWRARLSGQYVICAEDTQGLAGFMSLSKEGVLDFAYVHPRAMGSSQTRQPGCADLLYAQIKARACDLGVPRMTTQASHLARAFLARHGWRYEARSCVTRGGVEIENHLMFFDL